MTNVSKETRVNRLRSILKDAGEAGTPIIETTPSHGGFRIRDAELMISLGEAEWIDINNRVRMRTPKP